MFKKHHFHYGCGNFTQMEKVPNALINASSPYLLQHAYNPVEWNEWGEAALHRAKSENKLLLISIGYSACHWCHVMEGESFESHEVAEIMNRHFVCVKVDREERPDIDQIYMLSVQLMNGNGGWPLNVICLPDQRPIYGGTYFQKPDWINILLQLATLWKQEPAKAIHYATRLTAGIQQAEKLVPGESQVFTDRDLLEVLSPWKRQFDLVQGGYNRAPKFPLPNNWTFLLRYAFLKQDEACFTAATETLHAMARGGIYDQIGGGFARYSVDDRWHVPHFEKMLYDNAQLIHLYSEAYQWLKAPDFKTVVEETIAWTLREMQSMEGLFYSALDADSEGVEGKFYTWTKDAFDQVLLEDAAVMASYYEVTGQGNWEEEQVNILQRRKPEEVVAKAHGLTVEALTVVVERAKKKLLDARSTRIRPALDDKCLTSWNAMMASALLQAAQVFGRDVYYEKAREVIQFLLEKMRMTDGGVYRNYKAGNSTIPGFLDDYAFLIEACLALYQYDFDEKWLHQAKTLTHYVYEHFEDDETAMFFYTSSEGESLIARKHEVMDNVISSSNSVMAQNLQLLSLWFDHPPYREQAGQMLNSVLGPMKSYGSAYANWAIQLLNEVEGINEIVITGKIPLAIRKEFGMHYIPNKIFSGGTNAQLPLLKDKPGEETKIYICKNKTCQLPVKTVAEAVQLSI